MAESSKGEYRPVLTCWRGEYGPVLTCSRGEYDEILLEPEQYFLVLASRGLCHGRFKSSLGNTLCLEGNIATAIFQYSIFR